MTTLIDKSITSFIACWQNKVQDLLIEIKYKASKVAVILQQVI